MSRVFIIADDLTGACDSAVAFLASGRSAAVVLDGSVAPHDEDVIAFTTESRNLPAAEAAQRVTELIAALHPLPADTILFKKIDSAARGHLAPEVEAALAASGATLALVAPAFPAANRTVRKGILQIKDFAGQNTTVPLTSLFRTKTLRVAQVAAQLHRADPGVSPLAQALQTQTRILLCDAETQSDLEHLAAAALASNKKILYCGSAGLAQALAAHLPSPPPTSSQPPTPREGKTLLFAGTNHPVTTRQLSRIHPHRHTNHLIDLASTTPEQVRTLFAAAPVSALILTGGDTAAFVLRALSAQRIALAGELTHGIPWGFIEGGLAHNCLVVTKSGGFGHHDTLVEAFNFCERSVHAPA